MDTFSSIFLHVNASEVGPRQVLLVSAEVLREFKLQPGDLRENIIVDKMDVDGLPSGSVLQIGHSAKVRLTYHCEVCKYIGTLGVKPIKAMEYRRGFLAVVLADGEVRIGDAVRVLDACYEAVPDRTFDRFLWVARQIPAGKVMTYKQILNVLGVSRSYYRVLPNYMKWAEERGLQTMHRILDSKGCLVSHLEGQKAMLEDEGVIVVHGKVDEMVYGWDVCDVYY